jgi:catechol 2,3-dioxygenase-like lactoylglutathione lyase family enzyme
MDNCAMPVRTLQHINIRCIDADAARDFYVALLGLRAGPRPPFRSHGHWLYLGDTPVVHLVQKELDETIAPATGPLNHIAFEADDLEGTRLLLRQREIAFREAAVPRDGTTQLFLSDLDGVPLELNFVP